MNLKVCHEIYLYSQRIPLAWLQLTHKRRRLAVAILGISFSIVLIFTQLGIRAMLFDGVTLLPESLNGDLYLLSAYSENIRSSSFPNIYLYQARSIKGIADVRPLYVDFGDWIDPKLLESNQDKQKRKSSKLQILAYNPAQPVFTLPEINQQANQLTYPGSILYDKLAKAKLGEIPQTIENTKQPVSSLVDNKQVTVLGLFSLGSTFYSEGRAIMSSWNYAQMRGINKLNSITLGILSLEPEANQTVVIKRIEKNLSQDIKILTPKELAEEEKKFVAKWPEGKVLNFGVAIGFLVGIIVVYQIIFTDISENLPEYATLKAIGFSNHTLSLIVMEESLILALMGFIPGYWLSHIVYFVLAEIVELPVQMRASTTLQVFLLDLLMCGIAGVIAIKKLNTADPADIFN